MRLWEKTETLAGQVGTLGIVLVRVGLIPIVVFVAGVAALRSWVRTRRRPEGAPRAGLDDTSVTRLPPDRPQLTYLFSSFFLRECLSRLTPGDDEELGVVTGVRVGDLCVPHLLLPLEYEFSSPCGCAAKMSSSHACLREVGEEGHTLLAMFHSHPGTGQGSVRESATDIATQDRFERAGYQAITGIFSRDGHIRFFTNKLRFHVQVYGAGVKEVSKNVYRIEQRECSLPMQAARPEATGRSEGLGHAGEGRRLGSTSLRAGDSDGDRSGRDHVIDRAEPGETGLR